MRGSHHHHHHGSQSLDIQSEELSDARWAELLPLLQQPYARLERLWLENNDLTEAGLKDLASVLRSNPSLRELNLSHNKLGDAGVRLLLQGLLDPGTRLEKLDLNDTDLTEAGVKDLASVLRSNPSLRELSLSTNKLGDAGVRLLLQGLLDPGTRLEKLYLEDNDLTEAGLKDLASVLRSNPSLRELNLSDNKLGDAGVRLLLQGLLDPGTRLEELQLRNTDLTEAGVEDLASVLRSNPSLRELSLSNNKLGDAGVRLLLQGLLDPGTRLEKLYLRNTDLTEAGMKDLASVLRSNPSLRELSLSTNKLGDAGVRLLLQGLLDPGTRLEQLVLYDIYWSEEMEDRLQALEKDKPSLRVIS
nr:leucine-rich repeat protein N5C [synthetic construct]